MTLTTGLLPLQSPLQAEKLCCAFGVAVRVTVGVGSASPSYVAAHVFEQLAMPPLIGTGVAPADTLPPPLTITVSAD